MLKTSAPARGLDPWCWPERSRPLGTRMHSSVNILLSSRDHTKQLTQLSSSAEMLKASFIFYKRRAILATIHRSEGNSTSPLTDTYTAPRAAGTPIRPWRHLTVALHCWEKSVRFKNKIHCVLDPFSLERAHACFRRMYLVIIFCHQNGHLKILLIEGLLSC